MFMCKQCHAAHIIEGTRVSGTQSAKVGGKPELREGLWEEGSKPHPGGSGTPRAILGAKKSLSHPQENGLIPPG